MLSAPQVSPSRIGFGRWRKYYFDSVFGFDAEFDCFPSKICTSKPWNGRGFSLKGSSGEEKGEGMKQINSGSWKKQTSFPLGSPSQSRPGHKVFVHGYDRGGTRTRKRSQRSCFPEVCNSAHRRLRKFLLVARHERVCTTSQQKFSLQSSCGLGASEERRDD